MAIHHSMRITIIMTYYRRLLGRWLYNTPHLPPSTFHLLPFTFHLRPSNSPSFSSSTTESHPATYSSLIYIVQSYPLFHQTLKAPTFVPSFQQSRWLSARITKLRLTAQNCHSSVVIFRSPIFQDYQHQDSILSPSPRCILQFRLCFFSPLRHWHLLW